MDKSNDITKLAREILEYLFNQDPYNDNCDHHLHDLSRQLAKTVLDYDQNLLGPTGQAFIEMQAVERIKAEQREKHAQICDRLAEMMESGAGEDESGNRLRQAGKTIREQK